MQFLFLLAYVFHFVRPNSLDSYDLRGLTRAPDKPYNYTGTFSTLFFNFNAPLKLPNSACPDGCIACVRYPESDDQCMGLNKSLVLSFLGGSGIQFDYTNDIRQYQLKFICSNINEISGNITGTQASIAWRHPQACPINKKLSFGSVALIVLLILVVLYFAIGIPVMIFVFHKKGIEIVPFIHFWLAIPRLVYDGVRFLFTPCCGRPDYYDIVK